MGLIKIDLNERGETENVGSASRFQVIPIDIIDNWPINYGGKLFGPLTYLPDGDCWEFNITGHHVDFNGDRDSKGNNDTYKYSLECKVPENRLDVLAILEQISNRRCVVVYFPYNGNGNRLLGAQDVACYLKYKEDYGADPEQLNHYKVVFACELPYPAGFLS